MVQLHCLTTFSTTNSIVIEEFFWNILLLLWWGCSGTFRNILEHSSTLIVSLFRNTLEHSNSVIVSPLVCKPGAGELSEDLAWWRGVSGEVYAWLLPCGQPWVLNWDVLLLISVAGWTNRERFFQWESEHVMLADKMSPVVSCSQTYNIIHARSVDALLLNYCYTLIVTWNIGKSQFQIVIVHV